MPSFSEGIVLPAPSRADRKIQNVSKWHCTVHTVRGSGAGTRMQGESKLEADHQALQYAQPDVEDVVEQALFKFGWRDEKRHVFDMLVTKTTEGPGHVITPRAPDADMAPKGGNAPVKSAVVKSSPDVVQDVDKAGTSDTMRKPGPAVAKFGLPPKRQG